MADLIASDRGVPDRTADRLLLHLKAHGRLTTAVLAERLEISVPGVRQHLIRLRDSGLVADAPVRAGVGRPSQGWELTKNGHDRFPDAHAVTLVAVLQSIRSTLGEAALDRVIEARARETERTYRDRLEPESGLVARLEALTHIRQEEGYMAELHHETGGSFLLAENHCPICAAAQTCQGFCRSELELFRTLLAPAVVTRVEYLLEGARRCAYRVHPGTPARSTIRAEVAAP